MFVEIKINLYQNFSSLSFGPSEWITPLRQTLEEAEKIFDERVSEVLYETRRYEKHISINTFTTAVDGLNSYVITLISLALLMMPLFKGF